MAFTTADKAKVVADFQRAQGDTGSPEVQIALLTNRINDLAGLSRNTSRTTIRAAACCAW